MKAQPARLAEILRSHGVESQLELLLLTRLERAGLPRPETQARILDGRRFAFDFVYRAEKLAVEVQGGIWSGGSHARGSGVKRDCEKLSMAAAAGWRVMPVDDSMIESGQAVQLIAQALRSGDAMTDRVTISCPRCGCPMVERENRQNGTTFMGCTRYPHCDETAKVPAYLEVKRAGGLELPGLETR